MNKKVNLKARLKQKFAKVWRKTQLKKISAGADAGEGGPTESLQAAPPTLTVENDAALAEVPSDEAAPNDPRVLDTLSISTASGGDSSNIAHLRPTGDLKPPSIDPGLSTIFENTIQSAVGDSLDSANAIEQDAGQPDVSATNATDGEAKKSKDWTLWDMAWEDLKSKDPQSKYVCISSHSEYSAGCDGLSLLDCEQSSRSLTLIPNSCHTLLILVQWAFYSQRNRRP